MIEPNEIDNWLETTKAELFVSDVYYHHHAYEIMHTNDHVKDSFISTLSQEIRISPRLKKTKDTQSKGIKAQSLNDEIRRLMSQGEVDLKFEVSEVKGVFYFSSTKSSIGGFDFAIINHRKNITALRNLCFGELQYHDGIKRWNKFLEKNKDLKKIADKVLTMDKNGVDVEYKSQPHDSPLIMGEIQFGNWALAYRDFFKVLKANVQNSIDCLIYLVPTRNLEAMLSDGIVTFSKTKTILMDFAKVVSVPVWVVGLDIKTK